MLTLFGADRCMAAVQWYLAHREKRRITSGLSLCDAMIDAESSPTSESILSGPFAGWNTAARSTSAEDVEALSHCSTIDAVVD